jgi:hypothetical protein
MANHCLSYGAKIIHQVINSITRSSNHKHAEPKAKLRRYLMETQSK